MSSPDLNRYLHQGWTGQQNQPPPATLSQGRHSQDPPSHSYYAQPGAGYSAPYVQPHYHNDALPQQFVAELPAPLPPAPPTITSDEQLKHDELLAHRLQNLEVVEARRRSSSAASQQQRPVSMVPIGTQPSHPPLSHQGSSFSLRPVSMVPMGTQQTPPLSHQGSSLPLRPHSTSLSSNNTQWRPSSFAAVPNVQGISTLPEVVPAIRTTDPANDLPIPVLVDQNSHSLPPPESVDGISLSVYLEKALQVPYPRTWRLASVFQTLYAYADSRSGPDWLAQQESFTWRTIRPSDYAQNPSLPSYHFKFTYKGGSFRDPRFSWTMTTPKLASELKQKNSKKTVAPWTYDLKLDLRSGVRKKEALGHGQNRAILTTYLPAQNYNSLRFVAPDGRAHMWVSSGPVSSLNGSRYDTVRHALFAATGHISDPLYGEIVADHTFWDGYIDTTEVHSGVKCDGCRAKPINGLRYKCKTCKSHDVCEACSRSIANGGFGPKMQQSCDLSLVCLPDEALYIRSPTVDPALVVATLQVMKDWERETLRDEKRRNPKGFLESEEVARECDLGIMSYWRSSDWDKKAAADVRIGTMVRARSTMAALDNAMGAAGGLVDAGSALAGHGTHGSHGGGGDGGGGGS